MFAHQSGAENKVIVRPPAPAPQPAKKKRRRRRNGEEDEPVLRTTCDNCTNAKVKCNGASPCMRCTTKSIPCEYTFKKRCGPKRRKGLENPANRNIGEGEGLLAPYANGKGQSVGSRGVNHGRRGSGAFPGDDTFGGIQVELGKEEVECLRVFLQNLNAFMPVTTLETITEAASAARNVDPIQESEEIAQLHHARKAVLHGAIALGAEFIESEEASMMHAAIARGAIKECFDAAAPELVGAYLILALYWTHQMDPSKIARYMGLAHQSKGILPNAPPQLVACLTFLSVVLYDAKVMTSIGCPVSLPPIKHDDATTAWIAEPSLRQESILQILSFVLLSVHDHAQANAGCVVARAMGWDPVSLAMYVDEAEGMLSGDPGLNDMARCLIMILKAYFLVLREDRHGAVMAVEPIVDLVVDNPFVLHLPIVWSVVQSVPYLLEGAARRISVDRLRLVIDPLATRPAFATQQSAVGRELVSVFSGESTVGAIAPRPAGRRGSILARQKVQTSSLNVTAGNLDARGVNGAAPGTGELLAVEPTMSTSRRLSVTSLASQVPASLPLTRNFDQDSEGSLAPSLISAALVTSSEVLRPSSPPPSRAGALRRSSGSLAFQYEPSNSSMLQLNIPGSSTEYVEGMNGGVTPSAPGVVVLPTVPRVAAIPPHSVGDDDTDDISMKPAAGAVLQADAHEEDETLEGIDSKLVHCARGLMARQPYVQQSFNSEAPVSLDQVASTIANLSVSQDSECPPKNHDVTSVDLDRAAEQLLTAKNSFIS